MNNITRELTTRLKPGCRVFQSGVRILVERFTLFTYPDLMVICGPLRFMPGRTDTLTDAKVIMEVLSPSTEAYDRGEKFRMCRGLPSLEEYVLVAQEGVRVERNHRQTSDEWHWKEDASLSDTLELKSLEVQIPLEKIYWDLPL